MTDHLGIPGETPIEPFRIRQRSMREEEILRLASQMLREYGCEGLNMDVLSRRLGISKATLYAHFRSKRDLISVVLRRSAEEVRAAAPEGAPQEVARYVARELLGLGDRRNGVSCCCLCDVACSYDAWRAVGPLVEGAGGEEGGEEILGSAEVLLALCAVVHQRANEKGRRPTDKDVEAVVSYTIGSR